MPDPAHGVVVLAAGESRRLGQAKQLLEIDGETLLHRAVRLAIATDPIDVMVVFAADSRDIRDTVSDLDCRGVDCADAASGMAASLRCGLSALATSCAGALVVLVDQPRLDAQHLCALRDLWRIDPQRAVASAYAGTIGVPALLPRRWFTELMRADTHHGARAMLRERLAEVQGIEAPQLAFDIDSLADLERWRAQS